jgi:alpha-N-arabinofuranosidase
VWYQSRYNEVDKITDVSQWPVAPRLLEDSYSVLDAVVFGSLMISLIRHADRVTSASLAQLVNVIAPIMTEPGGPAWRQTTFYPFSLTSRLARDVALELKLDSPVYETERYGDVPLVDAVVTHDPEGGGTTVFAVNRSLTEVASLVIDSAALGAVTSVKATSIFDDDIHAANTLAQPDRVTPEDNASVTVSEGAVSVTLPPCSWTVLTID